ncbi:MAG: maltose ABC transporter permease [Planctomycetes bacterium]|nr:maltose ABC transporter permease [Planctomycetota bacterium]
MSKIGELFEGAIAMACIGLYILIALGNLYWLWMSIQLGSFMMFVAGLFPPFFIVTVPVGVWSLLFSMPDWLVNMFGQ